MAQLGLDDVVQARTLLADTVLQTPLLASRALSDVVGGQVYLKCENLQRAGSFKIRGAYLRIARLSEAERAAGVVAASAGNHAQGVALAASLLGGKSTVYMPTGAPLPKIAATRSYGADVVLEGDIVDDALAAAQRYARAHDAVFIHPFDHPDIVAGQATLGAEIVEQCPDVGTILVGVGGGGLAAGVALAAKALRPSVKVIGVQAASAACFPASLAAGHPVTITPSATMADGIAVGRPGDVTYPLVSELVDGVVTVSEESLSRALLLCLERAKQVVEPAGAAAVAAVLDHSRTLPTPVVAVLSGGNIDPLLLLKVLRHGMAAAGRYLALRCLLPDRPGALAQLLAELAELGVNVLDVIHGRTSAHLGLNEAEVLLQMETRGPEHCEEVLGRLRATGYSLSFT